MPRLLRIVIAEELTRELLDRRRDLIASADACWASRAHDGMVALETLGDSRWVTGNCPLFDSADAALAKWAHEAAELALRGRAPVRTQHALLAYGLQARLRGAARARAIANDIRRNMGMPAHSIRLDVVASDPYLRDTFVWNREDAPWQSVHLHADSTRSPLVASLRERAAASGSFRSLLAFAARSPGIHATRRSRTVGLFVFGQRPLDVSAPIRDELTRRGWRVIVFTYRPVAEPGLETIDFDRAARISVRSFGVGHLEHLSVNPEASNGSVVSAGLTTRALEASSVVAAVQLGRHRRVLEEWRPAVVLSFGPDTMSLALQGAAGQMGIPSVLLPHGFLVPLPITWSTLQATATAVPGWPCAEMNMVNPLGVRTRGLVVVGHPDYDEILRTRLKPAADIRLSLGVDPGRRNVILLFAEWAVDLVGHAMQKRTLEMTAKALPEDAFLVCKLHPPELERDMCARVLGDLLDPRSFRIVGDESFSTPVLLRNCSAVVAAEHSMTLADAIATRVPAIGIRHPEQPFGSDNLNHPAKDYRHVCRLVTNVDELREAMITLTHDRAARSRLVQRHDAYIERFLFSADGRSSSRLADLVEHLAAGGSPEAFVPRAGELVPSDLTVRH